MSSRISAVLALLLTAAMTSLAFDMMEIVPGRKVAAQIGEKLVLSCRTSGCEGVPTFIWRAQLDYPLGGTVHKEGSNSFLTMERVTFESAHEYICIATCGEEKKQKRVQVDVYSFPEDPIIEISTPFILGKEAEVTCSIPKVYPSDRLEMSLKIGEKLIGERNFFEDPDTQFLQKKSLKVLLTPTEGDRGKDITCIAELPIHDMEFKPKKRQNTHILNIADEPRNTTITVIPSSIVKEGEDVTLICSTYGSPTPAVFWKKRQADGTSELILERDILTITNVQPEDMGYYECEAVNLAGKEIKATEIVVQVFSSTTQSSVTLSSATVPSTISSSTIPPSTISSTIPPTTISSSTIPPSTKLSSTIPPSTTIPSSTIPPTTISSSTIPPTTISSSTILPSTISTSIYQPEQITEMEDFTIHNTPHQKTDDKQIQQENEASTAAKDTNSMLYSVADDITSGTEEVIVIARREELDSVTTAVIAVASLATVASPMAAILLYISRKAKINGSYSLVNSPEQKV